MEIIVVLIPVSLLLVLGAIWFFVWSVRDGQYVDMDHEARRILEPDDTGHNNPTDEGTSS